MFFSPEDAAIIWVDIQKLARNHQEDPTVAAMLERLHPYSIDDHTFTAVTQFTFIGQKLVSLHKDLIESWIQQITLINLSFQVVVQEHAVDAVPEASDTAQDTVVELPLVPETSVKPEAVEPGESNKDVEEDVSLEKQGLPQPTAQEYEQMAIIPEGVESEVVLTTTADLTAAQSGADTAQDTREDRLPSTQQEADTTQEQSQSTAVMSRQTEPVKKTLPVSDYTFDTFVVGEANRIAYDVALAAAEGDKVPGNPVFFHSESGLGKTHLLFAIMNYIKTFRPGVEVVYASSNNFINDYVDDIVNHKRRGKEVMKMYRNCDVLLVDDVQFLKNKQETVTTFFDIFNQLTLQGKLIVLTADEPPDYLQLDNRIKTRFNSGMVLSIAKPSRELKLSILKSYYERKRNQVPWFRGMRLRNKELSVIEQYSPNSIREMLGFLNTVMMKASASPEHALDEEQIRLIHEESFRDEQRVNLPVIVRLVAKEYGVSEQDIRGKRRTKTVSEARQVCMWLARQMTDGTFSSIGSYFDRDHATALTSINKIDRMSQNDRSFMYKLEHFQKAIKNS